MGIIDDLYRAFTPPPVPKDADWLTRFLNGRVLLVGGFVGFIWLAIKFG